jgi:hypothetical protein
MTTLQIIIVCLTQLAVCFLWMGVRMQCETTKRMSIASQERVYNSARRSNMETIAAMHGQPEKRHESWCDSLDGKQCNCHFSRD